MENQKRILEEPDDTCSKKIKDSKKEDAKNLGSEYSFSNLPHEILLMIFKKLNMKDICKMARVCKKWRRAAYDEILWYHIDLSDSSIPIRKLWKFFRHCCFPNAQSIRLCGNLKNPYVNRTKQSVTKALMEKLKESCKNIKILEISYADLISVSVVDFPSNLEELRLIRCEIPLKWFDKNQFTCLKTLTLTESSRICSTHLQDLSKTCKNTILILNVKKCYRIDDKAIETIVNEKFASIEFLDIEETSISALGFQLICTRLSNQLKFLNIRNCKNLKSPDLNIIRASFSHNEDFNCVV